MSPIDFFISEIVPILGTAIIVGITTLLAIGYSRWRDRRYRGTQEYLVGIDIAADIASQGDAGTTELRTIAKVMHVKGHSKLTRDELILAIIAKKEELLTQSAD